MSVGRCGPFGDGDDFDSDAYIKMLPVDVESLLTENRLLRRELTKTRAVIKSATDALQNILEEKHEKQPVP